MSGNRSDLAVRTISGIVMIVIALACLWAGGWLFAALVLVAGVAMVIEWERLTRSQWPVLRLAGLPYVLLPIAGLLVLRRQPDGFILTLWILVVVWATDIGAYFAGSTIGGPKLAPLISPGKTWAGLMGGIVAATAVGYLISQYNGLPFAYHWLGAPLAILAQLGDLFESWLKRRAGVKDSGTLLPGHGGVLDRLDGLVPVASVMGVLLWAGLL